MSRHFLDDRCLYSHEIFTNRFPCSKNSHGRFSSAPNSKLRALIVRVPSILYGYRQGIFPSHPPAFDGK
jgi:hypothetical protein